MKMSKSREAKKLKLIYEVKYWLDNIIGIMFLFKIPTEFLAQLQC